MSGETQSRHCLWLMLAVSLSHSMSGHAVGPGHTRSVLSWLAETMREPSGLNATPVTQSVWPVSGGPMGWPVSASHSRTVLSPPETMRFPSGLNATLYTAPVWPVSGAPMGWPVSAFHIRRVLSSLPETIRLPSGLNATLYTAPVWPVSGADADGLAAVGVPNPHRLVPTAG